MKFKDDIMNSSDSKDFIKLKSGESVSGVFRGEPFEFRQHWIANRSQMCMGDSCQECAKKVKSIFRFRINFVTTVNGTPTAFIFEQGLKVYKALGALNNDYPLEKNIMKITRNGTGENTTYTILPVPNGTVTPDREKMIAMAQLHDLQDLPKEEVEEDTFHTEDDIPF